MKILVLSDSHGKLDGMIAATEKEKPDTIFFLGDHEKDGWKLYDLYPDIPLYAVHGNCDRSGGAADWLVEVDGIRFWLTHGHNYGVKAGFRRITEAGVSLNAEMVCFGHTHEPIDWESDHQPRLFNPGTIGGPRGEQKTYGVIETKDGKIWDTEIKRI